MTFLELQPAITRCRRSELPGQVVTVGSGKVVVLGQKPGHVLLGLSALNATSAAVPPSQAAASPHPCINCHSDGKRLKTAVGGGVDVAASSRAGAPWAFSKPSFLLVCTRWLCSRVKTRLKTSSFRKKCVWTSSLCLHVSPNPVSPAGSEDFGGFSLRWPAGSGGCGRNRGRRTAGNAPFLTVSLAQGGAGSP